MYRGNRSICLSEGPLRLLIYVLHSAYLLLTLLNSVLLGNHGCHQSFFLSLYLMSAATRV
jgi:hypothetical protein